MLNCQMLVKRGSILAHVGKAILDHPKNIEKCGWHKPKYGWFVTAFLAEKCYEAVAIR